MRTRPCDPVTRRGRLRKARAFLQAGVTSAADDDLADAAVTLYVHAGIAAADVICCVHLGEHARGEDHHQAAALLEQADRAIAKHLKTLVQLKSKAGYAAESVSEREVKRAARAAERLVSEAERLSAA